MSDINYIKIPMEVSPKGQRTFILDSDEFETVETGVREKDQAGKKTLVNFIKFMVKNDKR